MCGRLSQYHGIHDFVDALSMPGALANEVGEQPLARFNVAPSTNVAVITPTQVRWLRWGWRPQWAHDRAPPINARVEKVAHSPFFRAIWGQRLLVPVDGWFEWVDEGEAKKQPYYIRRRDGLPAFCAGIGQWRMAEDDGFVIVTADSVGGMVDIHDRRPVVFAPELARDWLNPACDKAQAEQMLVNLGEPAEAFAWYRVDKAVGNVRNQGAGLIQPQP
ncbi:SOS response-associated peptidase [Pseudomonas auratipiscis]|uniref:Abasic site processing protein n=1 Tax=Pseudomonas auratipiscis TaxID=3115853 RepID=A0AB35WWZ1_9PSED|nr:MULTISPECIES: SOS response-associated peptidase [unclassified Pseudomonas]MEE1869201.1 SOS response-associated peptidase [Pseudomonas sp. 120P]MEE1959955.1 SOS response-associated peptidase [Pseudomonas sp. 119P]